MHRTHRLFIIILQICIGLVFSTVFFFYRGSQQYFLAHTIFPKPFVLRALLPWLAQFVSNITGMEGTFVICILIVVLTIGVFHSFQKLYSAFDSAINSDIVALLSVLVMFAMITYWGLAIRYSDYAVFHSCYGISCKKTL